MKTTRMAARVPRRSAYRSAVNHDLDAAYPMTPQQYYDLISRRHQHDGETRLLFAVLEDAIRCYALAMSGSTAAQREFEEVREWVNSRGDRYVFGFDSICRVFDIEPDRLRSQLNSMRIENFPRRRLRTIGRRTPMSVPD